MYLKLRDTDDSRILLCVRLSGFVFAQGLQRAQCNPRALLLSLGQNSKADGHD